MSPWLAAAPGAGAALAVFLLLLVPVGYALLRWGGGTAPRIEDLGLAVGLGYGALLPLAWLAGARMAPFLLVLVSCLCALALRREWRSLLGRRLASALALPLLLGGLAFAANGGDTREAGGALLFRAGFDVSDRAFYALVGQEMGRALPPATHHPLFAGIPLAYSFFPAILGGILQALSGASTLPMFLVSLPVVSFVFIGLAVDAVLLETGIASRGARAVTVLLVVLGGDLSFFLAPRNLTTLDRTRHFLAFHSFSAECLFYNTWALGLPLALVALALAHRWLREGGIGWLLLAGFATGSLWETKLFAVVPLVLGATVAALLGRETRLAWLALVSAIAALPWAVLTLLVTSVERGAGFALRPLFPVRLCLALVPAFDALSRRVNSASGSAVLQAPWLAAGLVLFLVGGFGVRFVGLPRLVGACRQRRPFDLYLGATIVSAVVLSLLLVGRPVPTDGAQFLLLAQLLAWLYAGPVLGGALVSGQGWSRPVAAALIALALVGPLGYLARKSWPERLTPEGTADRLWVSLGPDTVAAARWLAAQHAGEGRLLFPLEGDPEDLGGLKALYVAVLARQRLSAFAADFSVDPVLAEERRQAGRTVYATGDPAEAERALARLETRWIWDTTDRPLRFASSRVVPRFESGPIRVWERTPTEDPR